MTGDARGFHTTAAAEVDHKADRVAALARRENLAGILIVSQHNFAWLSGGRSNRVDASSETGVGALLIAADGRRWVISNNIEADRFGSETLPGLGFEVVAFPWEHGRADSSSPWRMATSLLDGGQVGADTRVGDARVVEPQLARERARLTSSELQRYAALGSDAAGIVGAAARQIEPGTREDDSAAQLAAALHVGMMRPLVLLVGGDSRITKFRHPVPTALRWRDRLLIAVCAERDGLVVALSRIVSARPDADLRDRTDACAAVFGRLAAATVAGATGGQIFAAAVEAYRAVGHGGEERLHHQGGAIGYKTREWVAHPESEDIVQAPQAFAWNPSITGTKVEETLVLREDGGLQLLTHDPEWPSISLDVRGTTITAPGVWVRDA